MNDEQEKQEVDEISVEPSPQPEGPAPVENSVEPQPAEPETSETEVSIESEVANSESTEPAVEASGPAPVAVTGEEIEAVDEEAGDGDDDEDEVPAVAVPTGPVELNVDEEEEIIHRWYILKVQSNRERSISASLQRKVSIEGLDDYFAEILVPTEKVTEFKGGKKKIVERKIWPGYIAVNMHVNDDTWFAIRETSGIGDFTGSGGKPTPMADEDVKKILPSEDPAATETEEPKLDIKFRIGDKVKVMEGNFENFEGEVSTIDEAHGRVTVMLSIFGRPTPVELEYWQVEVV